MKLSEAIRLGSMIRPQAFGDHFRGGGSCAMGAAMEAVGMTRGSEEPPEWLAMLSATGIRGCPVCHAPQNNAIGVSIHLNDWHRWTREQIADWVETIERQTEQPQQISAPPPVPVAV